MRRCPNPECLNTELCHSVDDLTFIKCDICGTEWSTWKIDSNKAKDYNVIDIKGGKYKGIYSAQVEIDKLLKATNKIL